MNIERVSLDTPAICLFIFDILFSFYLFLHLDRDAVE